MNPTGNSGGKSSSGAMDAPNYKQLYSLFDKGLGDINKNLSSDISNAVVKSISHLISSSASKTPGGTSASSSDINRIIKNGIDELSKQLVTQMTKASTPSASGSPRAVNMDALYTNMDKRISGVMGGITTELSRYGIKLDPSVSKEITSAIKEATQSAAPKELVATIKDLSGAVKVLGKAGSDIIKGISSVNTMRKSGGGIDVKELVPHAKDIKNLEGRLKEIDGAIRTLSSAIQTLPGSVKSTMSGVTSAMGSLASKFKEGMTGKVSAVRKNAEQDPAKFASMIAKEFSKIINNIPQLKGNSAVQRLDKMAGGVVDLAQMTKVVSSLVDEISSLKSKGVNLNSAEKSLDRLSNSIDKIPKNLGGEVIGDQWKKYTADLKSVLSMASTISTKIKVVLDKKGLKDQLTSIVDEYNTLMIPVEYDTAGLKKGLSGIDTSPEVSFTTTLDGTGAIDGIKKIEGAKPNIDISTTVDSRGVDKELKGLSDKELNLSLRPVLDSKDLDRRIADFKKKMEDLISSDQKTVDININRRSSGVTKSSYSNDELSKASKQMADVVNKVIQSLEVIVANPDPKNVTPSRYGKLALESMKELKHGDDRTTFSDVSTKAIDVFSKTKGDFGGLIALLKEVREISLSFPGDLLDISAIGQLKKDFKEIKQDLKDASDIAKDTVKSLRGGSSGVASTSDAGPIIDPKQISSGTKTQKGNMYDYGRGTVRPTDPAIPKQIDVGGDLHEVKKAVDANVEGLSKSLFNLQKYIVDTLERELKSGVKDINTGKQSWEIVRDDDKQPISDYFKMVSGYNKKTSGKQWGVQIADTARLRNMVGDTTGKASPTSLITAFKEQKYKEFISKKSDKLPEEVGTWLKRMSESDVSSWKGLDSNTTKTLIDIKRSHKSEGTGISKSLLDELGKMSTDRLASIYKHTVSEIESNKLLMEDQVVGGKVKPPIVRSIAVPAAKMHPTGAATFETASGSERVIPKFAVYKTGFERMYEELHKADALDMDKQYAKRIASGGIRPAPTKFKEFNDIAKEMLLDLSNAPKDKETNRNTILTQYKDASKIRGAELVRNKQIGSTAEFDESFNKVVDSFRGKFNSGEASIDSFIEAMDKISLSAFDVVKSMETVDFKDIYQMFRKLMEGTDGNGPLKGLAQRPDQDSSLREYDTHISKLVGTIPIVEENKPRRYTHQEKIINLMSMATPVFEGGTKGMSPDQQKQFIRDLNLSLRDFVRNSKLMGTDKQIPDSIKTMSSLGVPESQAASIDEFRADSRNIDTKYLATFNATNTKMYTDSLSELVPFGAQFQQLGRNIASTTNGMAKFNLGGRDNTDFPQLRSKREDELISGGRYGSKGYGYNVTAELRNTSDTFEDQIIISGKLANVMTDSVKTLIAPDALGRHSITSAGSMANPLATGVSNLKEGQYLTSNKIKEVDKVFQNVLGIDKEYKGRADEALIKEVEKMITVVRGKEISVQSAKLAETFLNYYGRKFTTRFGSKGVSITPQENTSELGDILAAFPKKSIKVLDDKERKTAGLGTVATPKSMGSLVGEILIKNAEKLDMSKADVYKLNRDATESGNKFMMSMFTDSSLGVVGDKEAKLQEALYERINEALGKLDLSVGKDISGITDLKKTYKKEVGEETFVEKPIDIRISSYGAAKRGLQTENLESIMNNVISANEKGSTAINTSFSPDTYKTMLGTEKGAFPSLSEYSKALGFESSVDKGETKEDAFNRIKKDIYTDLVSKATKGGTKKIDNDPKKEAIELSSLEKQAERLSKLEVDSNYYSNIIDESGAARKSLVGSKFVEVVENPHAYDEWSRTDIDKQIKGERLNIPAIGAYAAIFGEQSQFVKELAKDIPTEAKKHWEYLKALQVLNEDSAEMRKKMFESAQKVDVKSLNVFTKSTGSFDSSEEAKKSGSSLRDTILDTEKYPGVVDLSIPSTKDPKKRESFYVPGAVARGTYPEPTIAGERGMDNISRRLQQVVNSAKNVDEVMEKSGTSGSVGAYNTIGRIKTKLTGYQKEASTIAKKTPKDQVTPQEDVERLEQIYAKMVPVLYEHADPDPNLTYGNKYDNAADFIDKFKNRQMGQVGSGKKNVGEALSTTIGQAVDQIIGVDKTSSSTSDERKQAQSVLSRKATLGQSALEGLSRQLGVEPSTANDQDNIELKRALDGLEKAKIEYYYALSNATLGKTGAVQEFLFTRKVPAIMGKTITASVDRTAEFKRFEKDMLRIADNEDLGVDLSGLIDAASDVENIRAEHSATISKKKKSGLPVLKQHELGVPQEFAAKLPVNYWKKYDVSKNTGDLSILDRPKQMHSDLAEMLKHRESLETALKNITDPSLVEKVRSYMDTELTPFIESVRFPFTGISSVQPYKAKLLSPEKGKKQYEKHSLMVPGVPEMDTKGFDIAKSKVEKTITKLSNVRDAEWEKETPDVSKIEKLNKVIDDLSAALSNVIPKYIAHQQKLDFDGDQIDIHSAKTAQARMEIAKHFGSITNYGAGKGTTSQALRDSFTYDAMQPSTGKYMLAEQAQAFSKKFPGSEGFEFLQKPFLTEGLEYLSSADRLGVLSGFPGANGKPMGPVAAIEESAPSVFRSPETLSKISDTVRGVSTSKDGKELSSDAYIKDILKAVESVDKGMAASLNEAVKNKLYDSKFVNTINANLFKLNTGRDTEALNRQLKIFERNVGFGGGGMIGEGVSGRGAITYDPTASMAKRFPKGLNTFKNENADIMGNELNTLMNEVIRVGIQKGLDVKHAGEIPIATEIAGLLSQGPAGVTKLVEKVGSEKSYGDLKSLSEINEKTLRGRLGKMPTDDIRSDAAKIAAGRGEPLRAVELNRKELTQYVIDSVGFKGFLNELSTQIIEEAHSGIIKDIKSWSPEQVIRKLGGRTPEQYAREEVSKQLSADGVNVKSTIEDTKMPLYKFRSSGSTMFKQRGAYMKKYGDVDASELEGRFTGNASQLKEYTTKYKESKALAKNLQDEFSDFNTSGAEDKGSYAILLRSSFENVANDQKEIIKLVSDMTKEGDRLTSGVMERVSGEAEMHSFTSNVLSKPTLKRSNETLEKYSRIVAVPSLGAESRNDLSMRYNKDASELAKKRVLDRIGPAPTDTDAADYDVRKEAYDAKVDDEQKEILSKAILVSQSDMILKAAKSKASEGYFLEKLFPRTEGNEEVTEDSYQARRLKISQAQRAKYAESNSMGGQHPPGDSASYKGMASSLGIGTGGGGGTTNVTGTSMMPISGDAIPVHIASIAQGIGMFLGASRGLAETTTSPSNSGISPELQKRIDRAKEISKELTGGLNELKDTTFEHKYRASQLKGGAGNKQVNEISKTMSGEEDSSYIMEASSLRGTGIHGKLESKYRDTGAEIEVPTRYIDDIAGEITGTIDVLRRDIDGVVSDIIDIKTISPEGFKELQQAVKKANSNDWKDVKKELPKGYLKNEKLDNVASQLNLYMAAENKGAKAEAHFYDSLDDSLGNVQSISFGFDEGMLKRDMGAVSEARKKVSESGKSFAKTGSFDASLKIHEASKSETAPGMDQHRDDLIDELMATGKEYYELVRNWSPNKRGMAAGDSTSTSKEYEEAWKNMGKARSKSSDGLDQFISRIPVAAGDETIPVYENLSNMHQASKMYQQQKGIAVSGTDFTSLHGDIQSAINRVPTEGKDMMGFADLITKLKESDEISFAEVTKAWKAYRVVIGDYYVKMMDKAKEDFEGETDLRSKTSKYGTFERQVTVFQDYVRDSLGKKTDIYTEDKRYITPDLARGAGVYMTPPQLARKASKPLGEDKHLIDMFKRLVDVEPGAYPIPKDAVRTMLTDLTGMDTELTGLLSDPEKVAKIGPDIEGAFDLSKVRDGLARIKQSLNKYMAGPRDERDAGQDEYLSKVLKRVTALENLYGNVDIGTATSNKFSPGKSGIIPVSPDLLPDEQRVWHNRNLEKEKMRFATPESEGGPKKGTVAPYEYKIFGDNKRVIENKKYYFEKIGDVFNSSGKEAGVFTKHMDDLNLAMSRGHRSFGVAIERVVKWGAAATIVYGGINTLKEAIGHISEVEYAMAQLKMVMNPLQTDFLKLQDSAIGFAKRYGVEVGGVLESMKVFAQQGLGETEVLDRTETATMASNITDLNSTDATEALTAAMKVFRTEGQSSMEFLDAWSNVESKAAIKAGDLADAMKKAASAGKNAGFSFDQLNGIVAAVGSVTRQTGKEVGTSLRFIFRRLTTDKGPDALRGQGINVLGDKGELRSGFDILGDLAGKWDGLTRAQKLSMAQAIGGTRQYNQLLVLMDNWDDVLKNVANSMDSKGSSERKNLILMETYAKQVAKTKASFSELKLEIGSLILPTFKAGLTGIRGLVEVINSIPTPIKAAGAALTLLFGYITSGQGVIDNMVSLMDRGRVAAASFGMALKKGVSQGIFESVAVGSADKNSDLYGLTTVGKDGATGVDKFSSSLGDLSFVVASTLKMLNSLVGVIGKDTGAAFEGAGDFIEALGNKIEILGKLTALAPIPGWLDEILGVVTVVASKPLQGVGVGSKWVGKNVSKQAQGFIDTFAADNTGLIKAAAPAVAVGAGLALMAPIAFKIIKALVGSAEDYKNSQVASIEVDMKKIDSLKELITTYDSLDKKISRLNTVKDPKDVRNDIISGEYKSPLLSKAVIHGEAKKYKNQLSSVDSGTMAGVDKFGNAILNDTSNLKEYIVELEKAKVLQLAIKQADIAGRFATELTETGGVQDTKVAWKYAAETIPGIGEMMAKNIKIGPAKALDLVREELNRLIAAKNANPLTTAFDKDISAAQETLSKATSIFGSSYSQFNKSISTISTKGLDTSQIEKVLSTPELMKGYEVSLSLDDKLNLDEIKGKVDAKDVLGSNIMKRVYPKLSGVIEPVSDLTTERFKESGSAPRIPSGKGKLEVKSGDYLSLTKEFADKYAIAGKQAFVKITGADEMLLSYFNKSTGKMEVSKKFSGKDLAGVVEAVFPVDEIIKKSKEDLVKLSTFVTGAAAGIVGMSDETLTKRDIYLGPRLYSDVDTNTLLQTNKGYDPMSDTFGSPSYKATYGEDFLKSFYKPMQDYQQQLDRARSEDAEPDDTIEGDFADGIAKLQDLLKNNQMVFQFRAALEDLNKSLYQTGVETRKAIAIEQERQKVQKISSGYLSGITEGIDNIDTGIRNYEDLSIKQKTLLNNPEYGEKVKKVVGLNLEEKGLIDKINKVVATRVEVGEIAKPGTAWGNRFKDKDTFDKYNKVSEIIGDDKGSIEVVMALNDVKKDTSDMATTLHKMLDSQEGPAAQAKLIAEIEGKFKRIDINGKGEVSAPGFIPREIVSSINKLMTVRDKASESGDVKLVSQLDGSINKYAGQLLSTFGTEGTIKAVKAADRPFVKDVTPAEMLQRSVKGLGYSMDSFVTAIDTTVSQTPEGKDIQKSKEYINLKKTLEESRKEPLVDSKTLGKSSMMVSVLSKFKNAANDKDLAFLTSRLAEQEEEKKVRVGSNLDLKDVDSRISATKNQIAATTTSKYFNGVIGTMSDISAAAVAASKGFGVSDEGSKKMIVAAGSIYALMNLMETQLGKEMPAYAKKQGAFLNDIGKKIIAGEELGIADKLRATREAKKFLSSVEEDETINSAKPVTEEILSGRDKLIKLNDLETVKKQEEKLKGEMGVLDKESLQNNIVGMLASIISGAAYDYVVGKADTTTKIASGQLVADKQTKAFETFVSKNAEAVDNMFKRPTSLDTSALPAAAKPVITKVPVTNPKDYGDVDSILEEIGEARAGLKGINSKSSISKEISPTRPSVLAMDVSQGQADVYAQLDKTQSKYESELSAIDKQKQIETDAAAEMEDLQKALSNLEVVVKSVKQSFTEFDIKRMYKPVLALGNKLSGFGGEVPLPVSDNTMTTQQRVFADSTDDFKNTLTTYQQLNMVQDKFLNGMTSVGEQISTTTKYLSDKGLSKDKIDEYEPLKKLKTILVGLKASASDVNTVLTTMGTNLSPFYKYADAFYGLGKSLESIKVDQVLKSVGALKTYFDNMDTLYGGSHPDTPVSITKMQERMGARVGIPLESTKSNKLDVKRAELISSISNDNLAGKQLEDALAELIMLQEQQDREIQDRDFSNQTSMFRRSMAPFEEFSQKLEHLSQFGDVSPEGIDQIKASQTRLYSMMTSASQLMPKSEKVAVYKQDFAEGKMTLSEFKKEMASINAGPEMQYRGISPKDMGIIKSDKDLFAELITKDTAVNPVGVTDRLDTSNHYLQIIADAAQNNSVLSSIEGIFGGLFKATSKITATDPIASGGVDKKSIVEPKGSTQSDTLNLGKIPTLKPVVKVPDEPYDKRSPLDKFTDFMVNATEPLKEFGKDPFGAVKSVLLDDSVKDMSFTEYKEPVKDNFIDSALSIKEFSSTVLSLLDAFKYGYNESAKITEDSRNKKDPNEMYWEQDKGAFSGLKGLIKQDRGGEDTDIKEAYNTITDSLNEKAAKFGEYASENSKQVFEWLRTPGSEEKPSTVDPKLIGLKNKEAHPDMFGAIEDGFKCAGIKYTTDQETTVTDQETIISVLKEIRDNVGGVSTEHPVQAKNTGGRIFGEGNATSDNVPAWLSRGEYVIREKAARDIGYHNLESMNRTGKVPRFADGGIVSDEVTQAKNYFSSSEAKLPDWSDPESEKYNSQKVSDFIELYKSNLLTKENAEAMIFNKNSLKEFYNELVDYNNTGVYGEVLPDDWTPMLKSLEEQKKKGSPKEKTSDFSLRGGFEALTGKSKQADMLKQVMAYAEGGEVSWTDKLRKMANPAGEAISENIKKWQEDKSKLPGGNAIDSKSVIGDTATDEAPSKWFKNGIFGDTISESYEKKHGKKLRGFAEGGEIDPLTYDKNAISTITGKKVPTPEEAADKSVEAYKKAGEVAKAALDYTTMPGAAISIFEGIQAFKDTDFGKIDESAGYLAETASVPAAIGKMIASKMAGKYVKPVNFLWKSLAAFDNAGDMKEQINDKTWEIGGEHDGSAAIDKIINDETLKNNTKNYFAEGGEVSWTDRLRRLVTPSGDAISENIKKWNDSKSRVSGEMGDLKSSKINTTDKQDKTDKWFKNGIFGDTISESYEKKHGKELRGFADGGIVSDEVTQAKNYFSSSEAKLPDWSDPESEKYNSQKVSDFIELYKSNLLTKENAEAMIFNKNSLKEF